MGIAADEPNKISTGPVWFVCGVSNKEFLIGNAAREVNRIRVYIYICILVESAAPVPFFARLCGCVFSAPSRLRFFRALAAALFPRPTGCVLSRALAAAFCAPSQAALVGFGPLICVLRQQKTLAIFF